MKNNYFFKSLVLLLIMGSAQLSGQNNDLSQILSEQDRETAEAKDRQIAMNNEFDSRLDAKDVELKDTIESMENTVGKERERYEKIVEKLRGEKEAIMLEKEILRKENQKLALDNKKKTAELDRMQAEKEEDEESIEYHKRRAQQLTKESDLMFNDLNKLKDDLKVRLDENWRQGIEIDNLKIRILDLEKDLSIVTQEAEDWRRRSYIKDTQDGFYISKIRCHKNEDPSVMDINFEMHLDWKDTRDYNDPALQFIIVEAKPKVIVYEKGDQKTIYYLDKDYKMDGYRIYQEIISDTNVNPYISLKIRLKNNKFNFFRKSKIHYRIPIEVHLVKLDGNGKIEKIDIMGEGELVLKNKGQRNSFEKHIQKNDK